MATKVNLQYLKSVRTRFYNVLDKEAQEGRALLDRDVSELCHEECKDIRQSVIECKLKMTTYIEKLSVQSGKLAEALGDTDDDLTDTIIEEDSELSEKALTLTYKLQIFEEDLLEAEKMKSDAKPEMKPAIAPVSEDFHRMVEHQMRLQDKLFAQQKEQGELQMKLQKDFLEQKAAQSSKVNLPKIDIITFNGNKLTWLEFWDSFEKAIHDNKSLSGVDKFNYLRGKLAGEARNAISGLCLSNENYDIAVKILHERYGDVQEIIDLHYDKLRDIAPARNTTDSLRSFLDKIERHLRSLEVLKENIDQKVFVSMIRRKLPSDVLLQLEVLKGADKIWSVCALRDLLRQFIVSKEKSGKNAVTESLPQNQIHVPSNDRNNKNSYCYHSEYPYNYHTNQTAPSMTDTFGTVERLRMPSKSSKRCRFCEATHWSDECQRFKTIDARQQQLKGSCYKCLKEGHYSPDCKTSRSCVYCGQVNVHHRSLCPQRFSRKSVSESVQFAYDEHEQRVTHSISNEETVLLSSGERVLMQTAITDVKHPECSNSVVVRLLLDSGSQRSYMTQHLADRLGLKGESEQEIRLVTFGSGKAKVIRTQSANLGIKLSNGKYVNISVNIVPSITGAIQRKPVGVANLEHYNELTCSMKLADTSPSEAESDTVELLIGNDFYLDFILSEKIEVQHGLFLLASRLGWILTGRISTENKSESSEEINMLSMTHGTNLYSKTDSENSLDIEQVGLVKRSRKCSEEVKTFENTKEAVILEDGRNQMALSRTCDEQAIPETRGLTSEQQPLAICGKQINIKCQKEQSGLFSKVGHGLVEKNDIPRSDWKFRRKVEFRSSSDSDIKSAKVQTTTGRIIGRPLKLLFPIEVSGQTYDEDVGVKNTSSTADHIPEKRPRRQASENARQRIKDML